MASLNVTYKVVWLDIELPEIAPAPDNITNGIGDFDQINAAGR